MSLVSLLLNYANPIVVSDLALSTSERTEPIFIPILNRLSTDDDFPGKNKLYSYRLKTLIVKDIMCVACTGLVAEIKEFQNDIIDFFLYREVSLINVQSFLEEIKDKYTNKEGDISVLLIVRKTESEPYGFGIFHLGQWEKNDNALYEKAMSSGSGATTWLKYFNKQALNTFDNKTVYSGNTIKVALLTCQHFLSQEMLTPDNLKEGWGAGFDIIYFDEGKFKRLNDIAYLFWNLNTVENELELQLSSVIHYSYKDDVLIMKNFNGDFKVYAAPTINTPNGVIDIPNAHIFSSNKIVNCVNMYNADGIESRIYTYIDKYMGENEDAMIHTELLNGEFGLGINQWLHDAVIQVMKDFK